MARGTTLIHGDFFPGSWLAGEPGVFVIDPEFAFFGPPEFDVGVFLAHLILGSQGEAASQNLQESYLPPHRFRWPRAVQFAGVEIMRRLVGVAQLPLAIDLDQKMNLLDRSRAMVLGQGGRC